jgi:hypothetical protein
MIDLLILAADLTGPRFRHRIEAVVERFSDMQADLDRERKTMTRLWAKREEQIRGKRLFPPRCKLWPFRRGLDEYADEPPQADDARSPLPTPLS